MDFKISLGSDLMLVSASLTGLRGANSTVGTGLTCFLFLLPFSPASPLLMVKKRKKRVERCVKGSEYSGPLGRIPNLFHRKFSPPISSKSTIFSSTMFWRSMQAYIDGKLTFPTVVFCSSIATCHDRQLRNPKPLTETGIKNPQQYEVDPHLGIYFSI